ncbi:AMP-binding protein [Actinomadura keratinilytica]
MAAVRPHPPPVHPSLARMLLADDDGRAVLAGLDHMLVGGEALDATLAGKLLQHCGGALTNMYGPTETTVWSAAWQVAPGEVSSAPRCTATRCTSSTSTAAGSPGAPRANCGSAGTGWPGATWDARN